MKRMNLSELLVKYTDLSGSTCHLWKAAVDQDGYGRIGVNGKNRLAHRTVWEQSHGTIPPGLHILHFCDNRACVRIDHLWIGTNLENVFDGLLKGRHPPGPGRRRTRTTIIPSTRRVIFIRNLNIRLKMERLIVARTWFAAKPWEFRAHWYAVQADLLGGDYR